MIGFNPGYTVKTSRLPEKPLDSINAPVKPSKAKSFDELKELERLKRMVRNLGEIKKLVSK